MPREEFKPFFQFVSSKNIKIINLESGDVEKYDGKSGKRPKSSASGAAAAAVDDDDDNAVCVCLKLILVSLSFFIIRSKSVSKQFVSIITLISV